MRIQKVLDLLTEAAKGNEDYREFNARIVNDQSVDYLGVRMPDLRKIAKEIASGDWRAFLVENTWQTHEEKMLVMLLPQYIRPKLVLSELFSYFNEILPHLSSWAQTDTLAMKFPQISDQKTESYKRIVDYVLSDEPWTIRLGIILLMSNFLDDEFIDGVLILIKNIQNEDYYVKMAAAWLLAEAAVHYREKVEKVLAQVGPETAKFARQKIRDSRRVS
jgi:3-methyladenine DNA glycosylase AlkD